MTHWEWVMRFDRDPDSPLKWTTKSTHEMPTIIVFTWTENDVSSHLKHRCVFVHGRNMHFFQSTSSSLVYIIQLLKDWRAYICFSFIIFSIMRTIYSLVCCTIICQQTKDKTMSVNVALFWKHRNGCTIKRKLRFYCSIQRCIRSVCATVSTPSSLDQQREKQTINRISIGYIANNNKLSLNYDWIWQRKCVAYAMHQLLRCEQLNCGFLKNFNQ